MSAAVDLLRMEAEIQRRLAAAGDLTAPEGSRCVWCERPFSDDERLDAVSVGAKCFVHRRPCRQNFEDWLYCDDEEGR